MLECKMTSDKLKLKKIKQWEQWFAGEIGHLHKVQSVESQNELKEKVLNRASYSFKNSNQQMNGRWEISAYCHLMEDLHLHHAFECDYDSCSFTIGLFGDLDQVNQSIKEDLMKYLDLPNNTSFKSEDSDEDFYDEEEEEDNRKYNPVELMTSQYVNSSVNTCVLNYIREKLGISSQVTNLELVAALVYIFPYDISVKSSDIVYEDVQFNDEEVEIDFTLNHTPKKSKERTYNEETDKDICCKPCEGRSIFDIGNDMLLQILSFLRFRYVATLSETSKTFYSAYLRSGWSFPIRMGKVIDSLSPILNKQGIERSLSVVRDARYYAFNTHPYFVQYLEVRYENIDYLSSVKTVMKVGNRTYSFEGFDDEGSSPYFTMDDITNGKVKKYYPKDHDFYCSNGDLVVRVEAIATLTNMFGYMDGKDLVEKFLELLPFENWRYVSEIRIGDEKKKPKPKRK
ncbi:hypothetical protein NAEGRDRAFT_45926 [Naegleria gruberi]|uniref:F-box domain-containing protein n=1 Tax=Naegleria gruberi TaxID=5762 RepID=D2V1N5_NAEGR|nr:uncharacterized protein NAEGRDRAFT_45926 [Naegleria gruberi]EFC49194.1 hypothetical protein NAEGRDRAFT_45926 [Naegleria gruberi]|eukprot:XP_002681938.1 hypothetical protein NAEGRDRAFT_45926 [Naegleria gruberi strain NEG-M]